MNLLDWLKPGIRIKRWLILGAVGILCIIVGFYPVVDKTIGSRLSPGYHVILFAVGILLIWAAVQKGIISILNLFDMSESSVGYKTKIDKKILEKRVLNKGPKTVVIGGGTGLSVLLRGAKSYTSNITAIVTVADDGGGSGILREDLGMLPPGDIRSCILALADTEPIMEQLLQYRFEEGSLKGQSFGNLLIAAMNGISGNFEEAIRKINDVLAVTGKVLPVTLEDVTLYAKLKNGKVIKGESQIPLKVKELDSEILQIFIKPQNAKPLNESITAILQADVVILGPGSLYTSVLPNLLVQDITRAIESSSAIKVYVTNVMTQPGETDGYGVWQHVQAIIDHVGCRLVDYILVNNEEIPVKVLEKYVLDGATPVMLSGEDRQLLMDNGIKIIESPLVDVKKHYIRHDADKLCQIITRLALDHKYAEDKNRITVYFQLKDRFLNS